MVFCWDSPTSTTVLLKLVSKSFSLSFPSSLDYRNEQQTQLINRFLNTSSLLLVLEEGSLFQQRHSQSTSENTHGANDANLCIFIIN